MAVKTIRRDSPHHDPLLDKSEKVLAPETQLVGGEGECIWVA